MFVVDVRVDMVGMVSVKMYGMLNFWEIDCSGYDIALGV